MQFSYLDGVKFKKMLGVYIREQRERLNMDYESLSIKSGIAMDRLRKIESGEVTLRATTLDKLKIQLELSEEYLEKLQEVAKIAFVDSLYRVIASESTEKIKPKEDNA